MAKKQKQFELIREWAEDKGIFEKGNLKTQVLKLAEEAGELAKAVLNDDIPEVIDAIGDCTVVLTNVAELANRKYYFNQHNPMKVINIENCVESAYNVIAKRKGKMTNGSFKKDE